MSFASGQARALRLHVPQPMPEGRQRLDREASCADGRSGPQEASCRSLLSLGSSTDEIRRDFPSRGLDTLPPARFE